MLRFSNGMQKQWPTSNWELYFILNNSFSFVNAVHELFFLLCFAFQFKYEERSELEVLVNFLLSEIVYK